MKRNAMMICLCLACLLLGGCAKESAPEAAEPVAADTAASDTAASESEASDTIAGLTIPIDQLQSTPTFWDWNQNGVAMQVIALVDSAGAPHIAYNTCQVCAGSPYAYFEYQNGMLYCMNCGNAFSLETVGQENGGCTPLPIGAYAQTDTAIVIPEAELQRAAGSFASWKKGI